jgi:hypothetical protein
MTLLTAFPTVAQNLGRLSKELIKRMYHCSRISSMIIGTVCMLCSSYILSWTQYLTSSVTKLLQSVLPDRIMAFLVQTNQGCAQGSANNVC